jgi:uncharacterized protein (DUF305 family)
MKKELFYGMGGLVLGALITGAVMWAATNNQSTNTAMMHDMSATDGKTGEDFDKSYLNMMISHLEMSVDVAKKADASAKHDQIKIAASQLIETQTRQIEEMKSWQMAWGYTMSGMDHSHMQMQ